MSILETLTRAVSTRRDIAKVFTWARISPSAAEFDFYDMESERGLRFSNTPTVNWAKAHISSVIDWLSKSKVLVKRESKESCSI